MHQLSPEPHRPTHDVLHALQTEIASLQRREARLIRLIGPPPDAPPPLCAGPRAGWPIRRVQTAPQTGAQGPQRAP